MRYYLIAGEASGDLHASRLITSLSAADPDASFRFFGGDCMTEAAGRRGVRVRHYRELAYMGFIPVLLHLPTILRNMSMCKRDIIEWQPDVVILIDYAGFNLSIAQYLSQQRKKGRLPHPPRLFYYIAPKLWAWKEYRIKNFRRDIDELFSILPFEKKFFEGKHHYPIHYVGNPTADEVRAFGKEYRETFGDFCRRTGIDPNRPIIAILAGSRRQEIKDNLPAMLESIEGEQALEQHQLVIAGAPGIERSYYDAFLRGGRCHIVHGETYPLLTHSTAALVTSGTATLETALFNVPQVVCYRIALPRLARWGFNHILKVKYISLVNLIADKEVVSELFADRFSTANIRQHLLDILPGTTRRTQMLAEYKEIQRRLGDDCAPDNAARLIYEYTTSTTH